MIAVVAPSRVGEVNAMADTPFDGLTSPESERPIRTFVDRVLPHWVTPNGISWTRIALVPAVVALTAHHRYGLALIIFLVAILLDLVDGPLARVRGQVTDFGKILDPIADKVTILAPLWTWWVITRSQSSTTLIVISAIGLITAIELLLLAARFLPLLTPAKLRMVPTANAAGKVKVWFQGWMVGLLLFEPHEEFTQALSLVCAGVAIILAIWSLRIHLAPTPRAT